MHTERVDIAGKAFAYRTDTRSWHPTFQAVVVHRRADLSELTALAHSLAPYATVYMVDLDRLPRSAGGTEVDALLEWTAATSVRKPLMIAESSTSGVVDEFSRRVPQFTLGVVVLPVEKPHPWPAGLLHPIMNVVSHVFGRSRPRESPPPAAEHHTGAPLLVLPPAWTGDVRAVADSIRRFAVSIRPSSPAAERLPARLRRV